MSKAKSSSFKFLATPTAILGLLAFGSLCIAGPGQHSAGVSRSFGSSQAGGGYGYSQSYSGGYGGAYSPYYGTSSYSPGISYAPPYWWAGPYAANTDATGPGYNPNAGYAWDSVSVLLLETTPAKARITLDGIFVGTMDCLGPFQLPMGEHTLRVDAAGYEPSVTVLHVEKPVLQQLEVKLTETSHNGKPGPKS
jgi:hypothetical protein